MESDSTVNTAGKVPRFLYILSVGDGIRPYEKEEKRLLGRTSLHPWLRIRDAIDRNSGTLLAVLMLLTSLLIATQIWGTLALLDNAKDPEPPASVEKSSSKQAP